MPRFNNYPDSFSKIIRRRSDNLSTTITPPTQATTQFAILRLKTNNTIDSVFTNSDFARGASASSADNLRIWNPKTGTLDNYYVRTSDGTWRSSVGTAGTNVVIQSNTLIGIIRRGATLKTYTVKDTARLTTYSPVF